MDRAGAPRSPKSKWAIYLGLFGSELIEFVAYVGSRAERIGCWSDGVRRKRRGHRTLRSGPTVDPCKSVVVRGRVPLFGRRGGPGRAHRGWSAAGGRSRCDDEQVSDDPDAELAAALQTIEELRAEVVRLRGLLGFDHRADDGHRHSWGPTLFAGDADAPDVDARSTGAAKLALIRSLFGARSDVFAVRWENATTGKTGWSPAVKGGWSASKRSRKEYLPLTDEVIERHLRGEETIGIYPLLPGDKCSLLACDFDAGPWALDALAYLDACHAAGVPAVLERSRSGNGAHVWAFFDGLVEATAARAVGASLLRAAMTARAELDPMPFR